MRLSRKTLALTILAVLVLPALVWLLLVVWGVAPPPGKPYQPPFNLSDRLITLEVIDEDGTPMVVFEDPERGEASEIRFSGEAFLREVDRRQRSIPFLYRIFDITNWTGLLWVGLGFLGQALFMGRMLIQWWASEKAREAVVPPAFWWCSLLGSSMLMVYFIWRVEIVGFLGQSTGWLIYVRNLWFIYGQSDGDSEEPATAKG